MVASGANATTDSSLPMSTVKKRERNRDDGTTTPKAKRTKKTEKKRKRKKKMKTRREMPDIRALEQQLIANSENPDECRARLQQYKAALKREKKNDVDDTVAEIIRYEPRVQSASSLTNATGRNDLDMYPLAPPFGCLIMSDPLSKLLDDVKQIKQTKQPLAADMQNFGKMCCLRALSSISEATEAYTAQMVLYTFIECIKNRCQTEVDHMQGTSERKQALGSMWVSGLKTVLEKSALVGRREDGKMIALVLSEGKRPMCSNMLCYPQGHGIGADAVLRMFELGMDCASCTIPVVFCVGESLQIGGVYLIDESMPVFCVLSQPLNRLVDKDLMRLETWATLLAKFVDAKNTEFKGTSTISQRCLGETGHGIKTTGYFPKPVRGKHLPPNIFLPNKTRMALCKTNAEAAQKATSTHRWALKNILCVYEKIRGLPSDVKDGILMPKGIIQIPPEKYTNPVRAIRKWIQKHFRNLVSTPEVSPELQSLTPILIYPLLKKGDKDGEGWYNLQESVAYLDAESACKVFHKLKTLIQALSANGIVFLDLRPANIMVEIQSLKIKLIDFEDVCLEGSLISAALAKAFADDPRYNLGTCTLKGGFYFADKATNKFFLFAIKAYLRAYYRPHLNSSDSLEAHSDTVAKKISFNEFMTIFFTEK